MLSVEQQIRCIKLFYKLVGHALVIIVAIPVVLITVTYNFSPQKRFERKMTKVNTRKSGPHEE